jgi:hypothetical protein
MSRANTRRLAIRVYNSSCLSVVCWGQKIGKVGVYRCENSTKLAARDQYPPSTSKERREKKVGRARLKMGAFLASATYSLFGRATAGRKLS